MINLYSLDFEIWQKLISTDICAYSNTSETIVWTYFKSSVKS